MRKRFIKAEEDLKNVYQALLTAAALLLFTVGTIILTTLVVKTEETPLSSEHEGFRMFDERTVEIKNMRCFIVIGASCHRKLLNITH